MFEAGLAYVRVDFHLHTQKDKEFKYSGEPNEYVKSYVRALKDAGINVGVLTNHNKFDKDEYKAIKRAAKKEDIFILPGVELTVKEGANGIHTIIVFNPEEWLEDGNDFIQTFLTTVFSTVSNPENRNTKCIYDLKNVLEKLEEYGRDYFVVFAHVDQKSGLFEECAGGLLESLAGLTLFNKRVLGLQKSRIEDNRQKFEKCFGYLPALVEGSDPKSIVEIGKGERKTYLKMGEYSFDTLKFALKDHKNRLLNENVFYKHGYIESISFQGGKLDGQSLSFSPGLNTLIGIRGSGKSSIIESIRYLFDISVQTDREYKESLIGSVLGSGGKMTMVLNDKHGKKYTVSRIYGEKANVQDENGNDINVSPASILDGIQYFGQKDLSSSADHENGLLEQLVSGKIGNSFDTEIFDEQLISAVAHLLELEKIPAKIEDTKTKKLEVEHKISIYTEKGVDAKLKKQTGFNADKSKIEGVKNKVDEAINAFRKVYESNIEISAVLQNYTSDYNKDLFERVTNAVEQINIHLMSIDTALQSIDLYSNGLSEILDELIGRINDLSDEFAEIKREIKDETLDVDAYVKMTSELETYKDTMRSLEEQSRNRAQIESLFKKSVRERNDALLKLFNAYVAETEKINNSQNEIMIEIEFKGDIEAYKAKMQSDFKGSGISEVKYQQLCNQFTDYVAIIEDWLLNDGGEIRKFLSVNEYTKFEIKLRELYPDLIKYQVPNKVEISYHDKLLKHHSIGQRASALMLFILTQSDNDIILIDQPEDDLDNKTIYDEVITEIISKKRKMQFIFATHNANIPVLGDAERVLVAEYQDKKIAISLGNIDDKETHKQIVDIMEGGKDAFEKRQLIYNTWR